MARIDDFRAHLTQGGARPTQFRVNLAFPGFVGGGVSAAVKGVFMCSATSLPASSVQPIEVPYRGRNIKIAGERVFQNWQVRILNDSDFVIRKALELWSGRVLEHGATNGLVTPSAYAVPMQVVQLDRNEVPLRTYTFHNCWPQNLSDINLDFGAITQVEDFNVEFSVDYWTVDAGDTVIQ